MTRRVRLDQIVDAEGIMRTLGIDAEAIRSEGFPAPIRVLTIGALWAWVDVEEWAEDHLEVEDGTERFDDEDLNLSMLGRRWPAKALIAATGETLRQTAAMLHIDPAVLCRPLSDRQAERYATALDLLPGDVWGVEWFDAPVAAKV